MRIPKNLSMLLLAIYLILSGLLAFVPALSGISILLPILAIAAGVLMLIRP